MDKRIKNRLAFAVIIAQLSLIAVLFYPFLKQEAEDIKQMPQAVYAEDRNGHAIPPAKSVTAAAPQATANPKQTGSAAAVPGDGADPVMLKIKSIGLSAPVIKTGLEADGSLHVPGSPDLAGWYSLGAMPGEIGPAVITGHYDSAAGPGVFYDLKNAKPGDEVRVIRNDGSVAIFTVDKLEYYPQDNFATQAVYGKIPHAGLRIITCAGTFDKNTKHYSDNLVVYASLKNISLQAQFTARQE